MITSKFKNLLIVLLMFSISSAIAQTRDSSLTPVATKKLFIGTGLQYISNLTYAGRSDIQSVPIFLPTITLVTKSGFFLSTAGYINAFNQNYTADGFGLTPGYVFTLGRNKKFGGVISATKYFFKDSSQIILSTFNATTDLQLSYTTPWVKFALSAAYQFGKTSNDLINTLDISKELAVTKDKTLKINPLLSLAMGTQSFTETYYVQGNRQRNVITNPPSSGGGLGGIFPGGTNPQPKQTIVNEPYTQEMQREVKKYKALSLSVSTPLIYQKNKFQFNFAPYFIKPFNTVSQSSAGSSSPNIFLFSTGINYTF